MEGGRPGKSGDRPRCGVGYAAWSVTVIEHRRVFFLEGESGLVIPESGNRVVNKMQSISGDSVFSASLGCCETVATVMSCLVDAVGDYIRIGHRQLLSSITAFLGYSRAHTRQRAPESMDGCIGAAGGFAQRAMVCWIIHPGRSCSALS